MAHGRDSVFGGQLTTGDVDKSFRKLSSNTSHNFNHSLVKLTAFLNFLALASSQIIINPATLVPGTEEPDKNDLKVIVGCIVAGLVAVGCIICIAYLRLAEFCHGDTNAKYSPMKTEYEKLGHVVLDVLRDPTPPRIAHDMN